MNRVCPESKPNPITAHSKEVSPALGDPQVLSLAEFLYLGCGRKHGHIRISLGARSKAVVGHNIEEYSVENLSLIESQLNAGSLRRRPILVWLPLVQSVEVVDDVHLHVVEDVDHIIVFERLPE
jgi:hypothetical protein